MSNTKHTPETAMQRAYNLKQQNDELLEVLNECEEYFDNKADADHDETGYIPNPEMQMLTKIRSVIEKTKHT